MKASPDEGGTSPDEGGTSPDETKKNQKDNQSEPEEPAAPDSFLDAIASGKPVEVTIPGVAFDVTEEDLEALATLWPDDIAALGEEPAQEEDPVAAFKSRHARDPLGLAAEAERKRAEVEHPDFTDASKDGYSWAGKPLAGFQALIMTPVLCPADKRNWPNELMKWSESWEDEAPTPEEAYECIKGIKKSEYRWMTFKTPYEDGFKAVMNVMLGRLRAGQPWDCSGDSGRHDRSNGGAKAQAQQEVIQAAMDERFDPETGLSREVMAQREGQ
ncbi:MAG: hypothetical protein ACYTFQ_30125 [Planctomycetota bacterium]